MNTPDVHPINIPVLEMRGNEAHSNGKYGFRIFDDYYPNKPSVIYDLFVWRNGKVGFTATNIGEIGFDGVVAVQNGLHVFEARQTDSSSWDVTFLRNCLFVDYTGLPLGKSYAAFDDIFDSFGEMGGPMKGGILLPWNNLAGGGMKVSNVTFVNFAHACLRGCAHCGRGGSPALGDGAFEFLLARLTTPFDRLVVEASGKVTSGRQEIRRAFVRAVEIRLRSGSLVHPKLLAKAAGRT